MSTYRQHIGRWSGRIELDNYSPPRRVADVSADVYAATDTAPETVVLIHDIPDAHRALYLLDDGTAVRPHYVAGWHRDGTEVYLHPFPLSTGTRPDNGRPVDMSGWALGPRRCYHVKIAGE